MLIGSEETLSNHGRSQREGKHHLIRSGRQIVHFGCRFSGGQGQKDPEGKAGMGTVYCRPTGLFSYVNLHGGW
jgi:hypothetical protein